MIKQIRYLEIIVRVLYTGGDQGQDCTEQVYDDYCDACIIDGKAITDILSGLKYKVKKR